MGTRRVPTTNQEGLLEQTGSYGSLKAVAAVSPAIHLGEASKTRDREQGAFISTKGRIHETGSMG